MEKKRKPRGKQKEFIERYVSEKKTDEEWATEFAKNRSTIVRWKSWFKADIEEKFEERIKEYSQNFSRFAKEVFTEYEKILKNGTHENKLRAIKYFIDVLGLASQKAINVNTTIENEISVNKDIAESFEQLFLDFESANVPDEYLEERDDELKTLTQHRKAEEEE